jgi:ribosomal protein S18 acetylase RimI-like enzyme
METFHVEFPGAKHVALGVDTTDGVVGAEHEFGGLGLELERNTVMIAVRSQVRAPGRPNTDATYRLLAGDADFAQLHSLTMAVNVPESPAQEDFVWKKIEAERVLAEAGHATWFGAFDGVQLKASLGLVFDARGVARFQNVQTHPDDRGRGLASALVYRASTYGLAELGAHTLVMVADPDYPAIRLYRALGFSDTEIQLQLTKPAP